MTRSCEVIRNTVWPFGRTTRRAFFLTAVSVILLVPSRAQEPASLDLRLFRSINATQSPGRNGVFEYVDYATLPLFAVVPVGFLLDGTLADDRSACTTGLLLTASEAGSLLTTLLLKEIVGRPRPFETLADVRVKHRWSAGGFSFPSGHTAGAFSIATILSLRYPRPSVLVPVLTWALMVGYSRIYLGVHYPSDVAGGALVGTVVALAMWQLRSDADHMAGRIVGRSRLAPPVINGVVARAEFIRISIPFR